MDEEKFDLMWDILQISVAIGLTIKLILSLILKVSLDPVLTTVTIVGWGVLFKSNDVFRKLMGIAKD